ncbi:FecR domain-containing protein [Bordetella petrii]|uniref:FecR domain-containing protein n=1 Tax=Bordetella petrii TaxID=94624 RepID=UPI001E50C648|nr:FecR domain-containing protein [Bordetella petrii]MCD0501658.1 FecR domain-containing protein [Bordetella petrii]
MSHNFSPAPRQRTAIQEAARWFARLQDPQSGEAAHAAWRNWLAHHPENRSAWSKVQAVQQQFGQVPRHVLMPTLQGIDRKRRRFLGLAALAGMAVPMGAWLADDARRAHWTADASTAIGEVAPLPLSDGSLAILDADSAADIAFTADVRRIVLRAGRLYTKTHADAAARPRPFIVQTRHGEVQALGTEFTVSVTPDLSEVCVNQHAVRITARHAPQAPLIIPAGHCATFSDQGVQATATSAPAQASQLFAPWRKKSLIATNMPLSQFVRQVRAYRPGYLFVDDSLAQLQVSGVFPLAQSDLALAALENSYPVRVRRMTRYLTWIEPAT